MRVGVPVFGHSFPTALCGFNGKGGNVEAIVCLQIEKLE